MVVEEAANGSMEDSSDGVALLWRVEWYAAVAVIGGVVMFAREHGRVLVTECCECDVDGGVVGVAGCDAERGIGFREIWSPGRDALR